MKTKAIICDLDGTLAIMNGRNPYDASTCGTDTICKPVLKVVKLYHKFGGDVILLSGRNDRYRHETEEWLWEQGVPYHFLFMRKEGDNRPDNIVKKEMYLNEVEPNWDIDFILDDRQKVVDMWRKELNLTCFQVNYGDF